MRGPPTTLLIIYFLLMYTWANRRRWSSDGGTHHVPYLILIIVPPLYYFYVLCYVAIIGVFFSFIFCRWDLCKFLLADVALTRLLATVVDAVFGCFGASDSLSLRTHPTPRLSFAILTPNNYCISYTNYHNNNNNKCM